MYRLFTVLLPLLLFASCYNDKSRTTDSVAVYGEQQADSMDILAGRHYTFSYNFIVNKDSLVLLRQQPEEFLNGMITDTLSVHKDDRVAVADVRVISNDLQDTVWVQVARDQDTFGWIHESELLESVVPDDPISQFISVFSDIHVLITLIIVIIIAVAYLMRKIARYKAKIVHFNDINTFYPSLLALLVASAASLYSSIQMFAPEMWQHFYFHPTLNPFSQPAILSLFLFSVWAILIVALACVDVVCNILPFGHAALYLCGLAGVCAVNYILFSITTLYYIGYLLLAAYYAFAIHRYIRRSLKVYICGNCGARLHDKGKCPVCGVENE